MLNVTKELTALARKLGYTGTAPDTVAKAINAITASVGEGGGEGGGGLIAPTFTQVEEEDESYSYSCDMTFAEVNAAVKAGKCCYAFFGNQAMNHIVFTLSEYYEDDTVVFNNIIIGSGVNGAAIAYDTTGITFTEITYPDK